jgi:FtsP/CotA-like multicopper oxidase with cupredoxin domain
MASSAMVEDAATPQVDRALFQGLQNYTNEVHPYLGEFVFHCHILEHEDNGMMGKILVQD